MFLPTTRSECHKLGWDELDIILVTGDSYIDSPFVGVAVIGKTLAAAGYRVGIIAQPDVGSVSDIGRLGEPLLFWGVSSGCVDSMVANYTATGKRRKSDDFTPGGINNRRPDRAVIVYTNLIRRYFKSKRPIILGGIEASLRRISHFDFWSNKIRRSILFDAKADILVYGMGEHTIVELADRLRTGRPIQDVPGICYIAPNGRPGYIELPAHERAATNPDAFSEMFMTFYRNNDFISARGLFQKQDSRFLIQNPPAHVLTQKDLDRVYGYAYERMPHPYYARQGLIRAEDTIRFSVTTHRGCYGECNFCAIAVHQGRTVHWRSEDSIVDEVRTISRHPEFKGYILDAGGPTANMYGFECSKKIDRGACKNRRCLYPDICKKLKPDHSSQVRLLKRLRQVAGIKKIVVASGIRHDLVLADKMHGETYLKHVIRHHVSGQMKLAPEHTESEVLKLMGKPGPDDLIRFRELFTRISREAGKKQFLTYYFIASHPGCDEILR